MSGIDADRDGRQAVLNSGDLQSAVTDLAKRIADEVRSARPDADVVVDEYQTTESGQMTTRVAASVTVRDVRAKVWQARDGLLTRAASTQGLEVKLK
jgi:hypothetical protein